MKLEGGRVVVEDAKGQRPVVVIDVRNPRRASVPKSSLYFILRDFISLVGQSRRAFSKL